VIETCPPKRPLNPLWNPPFGLPEVLSVNVMGRPVDVSSNETVNVDALLNELAPPVKSKVDIW
jgi:hypothetical protein